MALEMALDASNAEVRSLESRVENQLRPSLPHRIDSLGCAHLTNHPCLVSLALALVGSTTYGIAAGGPDHGKI